MFFIVSKVAWLLLQPSTVLVIITVAGVCLLLSRLRQLARFLAIGGGVLLGIGALTPVSDLLLSPLENRFPIPDMDAISRPAGIIVLGGALSLERHSRTPLDPADGAVAIGLSSGRATEGMALALRFPDARLVFSGGASDLMSDRIAESKIAQVFYARMGLPPGRLTIEDRSRNTFENAQFSSALLQPRPAENWILVTSASHMPRAVGLFRNAGFSIIPYPVDYRTYSANFAWSNFDLSASGNLTKLDRGAKEWAGLLAYWITGKTNEFLPGPLRATSPNRDGETADLAPAHPAGRP